VEVYDQVAAEKTLDFLQEHAKIEDVPPATPLPPDGPSTAGA
jgi:hypothetical protein